MDQKGCFLPGPILKVYWSILFNRKQIERSWLLVVVHHFKKLPNFHVLWFINALGRTLSMMPRLCCWTFVSWPTKTPKLPTGLLLNAFLFKVKFWGRFFPGLFPPGVCSGDAKRVLWNASQTARSSHWWTMHTSFTSWRSMCLPTFVGVIHTSRISNHVPQNETWTPRNTVDGRNPAPPGMVKTL